MNKRYWRTIGIFILWLFLVAYVFGAAKEALNSLNISISLIVLIGMEYVLGYGQDKRVIRSSQRKMEYAQQRRESIGEGEWNEYQIKNKRIASRLDHQSSQKNAGGKDIHMGSAFYCSFHDFPFFPLNSDQTILRNFGLRTIGPLQNG